MAKINNIEKKPNLRFPGFNSNWIESNMSDVFNRLTSKNIENNKNVLTISAQQGLVNQEKFFTKSVSAKDITGYYLLKSGDFAYNKSYSKGYPMGAIKRLTKFDQGVVSTLYICFTLKNKSNSGDFFEKYFDGGYLNHEINKIAQEGARNHGLLNISVSDFFQIIKIKYPTLAEQEKIAFFLSLVDSLIENLKEQKISSENYKKAIIQKIFTQEFKFKDEKGNTFPEWKFRKLHEVLSEHKIKSSGSEEVYSVSVHKGLINQIEHLGRSYAAANTKNYNLVKPHDIVYTKSPTGDFPLGIIKQSRVNKNVIVSPLYGIFTPETPGLGYMLDNYFESPINTKNYLNSIVLKGAKNTINITNKTFLSKGLNLPTSKVEQNKIGDFLISLDKLIEVKAHKLNLFESWKKGLMQQLFV